MTGSIPTVDLGHDVHIPQLGFGVFQIPPAETKAAVAEALKAGYRHIDTAKAYGNEAAVGEAVAESGIDREDLFITTKLWNDDQGYESALKAFESSRSELGLDYVDLYLIHWPAPKQDRYLDSWRALEKLRADGSVRAIGVSNFETQHLMRVIDLGGSLPAINQIECHPGLQQIELREFHAQEGIATEAWSPLAQAALLDETLLVDIAGRLGKTAAQVILRWHLEIGNVVIPKTVTASRMAENFDIFDFELSVDDLSAISTLNNGRRTGPDPVEFG